MTNSRRIIDTLSVHSAPAQSIRDNEKNIMNPALISITQDAFHPVLGVNYLWVLTQNDAKCELGDIYFGVENPLDNINAFADSVTHYPTYKKKNVDRAINEIKKESESGQNTLLLSQIDEISLNSGFIRLGHPTIAFRFDQSGKAFPANIFIAGELYYVNNVWYLNDRSGRYNHIQTHLKVKRQLLEIVADQLYFSSKKINGIGIKPTIDIIQKLKTPESIWERYIKKDLERLGKLEIGKILLLKAIKYSIPSQFDKRLGNIQGKYTPEFKAIKHWVASLPVKQLDDFVIYCSTQTFLEDLEAIFRQNKKPIPDDLSKKINQFIEFLNLKIKDEQKGPNDTQTISAIDATFFHLKMTSETGSLLHLKQGLKYPIF